MSVPVWTPEQDAVLVRMRDFGGHTFTKIGEHFGRSRCAALGRYYRIKKVAFPSRAYKPKEEHHEVGPFHNWERLAALQPAKYPYAADSSCPDFANDDEHCDAVLAAGGYPVLQVRR